jgi:disulfide bond formation protein DsbB
MTLEAFSTILTLGSVALFGALLIVGVGYLTSSGIRSLVRQIPYEQFLLALFLISVSSIAFSLTYQLVYMTPVCELCWWQRIFLYPVSIITFVALWYRTRETHVTVGILALGGFWYACYHYYYHFQAFVLGKTLSLPCSYGGLMPACTDSPVLVFGFITIPFMGIMIFGSMLIVSGLAYVASKRLEN